MKLTTFFGIIVAVILAVLVGAVGYLFYPEVNPITKQIQEAEDLSLGGLVSWQSTTTQTASSIPDPYTLKSMSGTLGSVIITTTGSGFNLYDATTTDIVGGNSARAATTTLWLAEIPASLAAGVYEFNSSFDTGLLIDFDTVSTVASTTITWR